MSFKINKKGKSNKITKTNKRLDPPKLFLSAMWKHVPLLPNTDL